MRKLFLTFSLALFVCAGMSGCANSPSNLSFSRIFEPSTASQADVNRAAALAWDKYQAGAPIGSVCSQALKELDINSQMPGFDENRCFQQVHAKQIAEQQRQAQAQAKLEAEQRAQALAKQEAEQKAIQEAKAKAFNQRIADIRAGKAKIQTADEATAIYGASNGDSLTVQPMLHPDGKNYVIHGYLDPVGGLQSDHFVLRAMVIGMPAYAYINVDESKISLPPQTRVGSSLVVVGTYLDNSSYETVAGTRRYMPVFNALFVQPMDQN